MIHILWMILKFILIVLGILLGLLVLAVLLVLFCPVRYRGEACGSLENRKQSQASVSVSWLFHGIILNFCFKDGSFSHSIRIIGIPLEKLLKKRKSGHVTGGRTSVKKKKADPHGASSGKAPLKKEEVPKRAPAEKTEQKTLPDKERTAEQRAQPIPRAKQEQKGYAETEKPKEESSQTKAEPRISILNRIRNKISALWDKLKKIPESIRSVLSKIRDLYDRIDYWKQFLEHPRVKEAVSFAWQKAKILLHHILPTRIEGNITFGCEDPALTGTVLAVLGITIPFHKNCIEITPVFEGTNFLEGNMKLRGRIYGIVLVKTALQIYFHKNIKYVINRWKHKEGSL